MAAPNRAIAAGSSNAFLGFYDENGFLTGGTPTAPSAGDTAGNPFAHLLGIKEASPEVGEPETEVITGDDIRLGEFDFDSIASRRFTATFAAFNLEQEANLLGTNVETVAEMKWGVLDIVDRVERDACLILQSRAKTYNAGGAKGKKAWSGICIPLATVIPLHRQAFSERAGAVYRLSITPQVASHRPWGITLSESLAGTVGATYMTFSADNPIHMHVFTGNAIITDFILKHRPVSAAKTAAYVDRVAATVASVNTTTRAAPLSAAPRAAGRVIYVYEWDQFNE